MLSNVYYRADPIEKHDEGSTKTYDVPNIPNVMRRNVWKRDGLALYPLVRLWKCFPKERVHADCTDR